MAVFVVNNMRHCFFSGFRTDSSTIGFVRFPKLPLGAGVFTRCTKQQLRISSYGSAFCLFDAFPNDMRQCLLFFCFSEKSIDNQWFHKASNTTIGNLCLHNFYNTTLGNQFFGKCRFFLVLFPMTSDLAFVFCFQYNH